MVVDARVPMRLVGSTRPEMSALVTRFVLVELITGLATEQPDHDSAGHEAQVDWAGFVEPAEASRQLGDFRRPLSCLP